VFFLYIFKMKRKISTAISIIGLINTFEFIFVFFYPEGGENRFNKISVTLCIAFRIYVYSHLFLT